MAVRDAGYAAAVAVAGYHALQGLRGRRPPFALCYHGIGDERPQDDPYGLMIPQEQFAAHVDALLDRGYRLVGVTELWEAISDPDRSANGLGAITFDDGLADTMHAATEVLSARGQTATAFLATGLLGRDHPDLGSPRRILTPQEVVELEAAGIEIGAHSVSHADLAELDEDASFEEMRASRETLEEILGHPVRTMAYPFGRHTAATRRAAERAGYDIACGCTGAGRWRPMELPREPVHPSTSIRRIKLKAAGVYAPLLAMKALDPRTWRRDR